MSSLLHASVNQPVVLTRCVLFSRLIQRVKERINRRDRIPCRRQILLALLPFFGRGSTASGRSSGSSSATCWHGSQLFGTFGEEFIDALSGKFLNDDFQLFSVSIDTDNIEDVLDVLFVDILSAHGGKERGCHVTHFLSLFDTKRV